MWHKQHYFHVHAHCSACWRGMRKIRFQVSGLWFFPEKRWKMSKQQFWCAVDSEERVWAINHLFPQTIFLSSKLMAKSCTMRKGWGGFNEQRKLSSAPAWFGGQPCTLSIRSLWIVSIWFVSTNMSSFRYHTMQLVCKAVSFFAFSLSLTPHHHNSHFGPSLWYQWNWKHSHNSHNSPQLTKLTHHDAT